MRPDKIIVQVRQVHQYGLGAWLIAYLSKLEPDGDGWIKVSDRQIHRDTGLPFRTIVRELSKLANEGILEIHREARKTPRYRFINRSWRTQLYRIIEELRSES